MVGNSIYEFICNAATVKSKINLDSLKDVTDSDKQSSLLLYIIVILSCMYQGAGYLMGDKLKVVWAEFLTLS